MVSFLDGWPPARVKKALAGLPLAHGYTVVVKPLFYRKRPSLRALCNFDDKVIVLQIPEEFRSFTARVYHAAQRLPGKTMRFRWLSENVRFRTRREVMRFLYCHEYLHWWMWEVLGRQSGAETACDRFALENFRRRRVPAPDGLPVRSRLREAG